MDYITEARASAVKQGVQLWLASVLRGSLVASAAWLSNTHPGVAALLCIPVEAFPWVATALSVATVSGVSAWLAQRRHTAIAQGAVGQAYRDGIAAAELVAAERSK